ncbi:MAG: hypothetical protein COB37_12505 [Kordiimonadales bacterium]|nr:MAG: hypothetical protein COB37_12505 [Kordiimonadales bacterium]
MAIFSRTYFTVKIGVVASSLFLVGCGESAAPEVKEPSKIADIYFRYAVEHAVGSPIRFRNLMSETVIAEGARCVQDQIVSKKLGIYGRTRLQSLFLKSLFPAELANYKSFISEDRIRKSASDRVVKLGFKSLGEAARSSNLIAKALVNEYAYYAQFNRLHQVRNGVQANNLVMMKCAPKDLQAMVPKG